MSGIIAGAGSSFPNDFVYLDWQVSTFTVAAGATGNTFAIPNTVKSVAVNSSFNTATNSITFVQWLDSIMNVVPTTNTTDNTSLVVQASIDGGATWSDQFSLSIGAHNQNKGVGATANQRANIIGGTQITGNVVQFRLVVEDATSPTTDALTLANIRVSVSLNVAK